MSSNVFIAPKIKVGFQEREDCFTKKLAYIIYYDTTGKLRKEKSWNSWIDKEIPVEEFDNKPMDGFTLNRDVKRYSGDWFSSKRTLIRVHDPRGFEFEVTTENLIAILMHTDCSKRSLVGQFVYAWSGQDLVLLPTSSEEYQTATKYTAGLAKKVKAKELVVGGAYRTKRDGDVVYMGKLNVYRYANDSMKYSYTIPWGARTAKKELVFTDDDGKTFFIKSSVEFLSELIDSNPVPNYAELMEKFNRKLYAHDITSFEPIPVAFDATLENRYKAEEVLSYGVQLKNPGYFTLTKNPDHNLFISITIEPEVHSARDYSEGNNKIVYTLVGYGYVEDYNYYDENVIGIDPMNQSLAAVKNPNYKQSHYYHNNRRKFNLQTPPALYLMNAVLDNGMRVRITSLRDLNFNCTQDLEFLV
jgi:hypothetical protein